MWCGEGDLNPHEIAPASSRLTVPAKTHWRGDSTNGSAAGRRASGEIAPRVTPVVVEGVALIASSNTEGDIQLELVMEVGGVSYVLGNYPGIREFAALVEHLEPGLAWNGLHFYASASLPKPSQAARFHSPDYRRGQAHFQRGGVVKPAEPAFGDVGGAVARSDFRGTRPDVRRVI